MYYTVLGWYVARPMDPAKVLRQVRVDPLELATEKCSGHSFSFLIIIILIEGFFMLQKWLVCSKNQKNLYICKIELTL